MPAKNTEEPKSKKKIEEIADISDNLNAERERIDKIVVRSDNMIYGQAKYYENNGTYPKSIKMNTSVFTKCLIIGIVDNDKNIMGCNVVIDNKLNNQTVIFS